MPCHRLDISWSQTARQEEQRWWATLAVQLVNRVFPQVEYWVTSIQYQRYFSQALVCTALIEDWDIGTAEGVRLLVQLARACSQLAWCSEGLILSPLQKTAK